MGIENLESVKSRAEGEIARLFEAGGWRVDREPASGLMRPDLLLAKRGHVYVVEVKAASEGRPDRVIALLSQALLQAQAYARQIPKAQPLAVIWVGAASPALLKKVDEFRRQFAPDVAIGLVSGNGVRHFVGPGLEALNANPSPVRKGPLSQPRQAYNLFSDLNQWLLKVLLAPELPERLLAAPRGEYRNVSELAGAADVSVMSAFRFAMRLREEGFLDESGQHLRLVRRAELFRRWQSAALRSSPEARMCFLIPGARHAQLRKLLSHHQACLGLFEAADLLGLGHVSGVPPYVYVSRISQPERQAWKELAPAAPGEQPHVIVKQALAPQSLFRGAVMKEEMRVADVLQVWLDVSSHPSRGAEQAELLRRKVLQGIIGEAV
jgi:hypothetical protein